jgi:cell division protein FtsI/penicillin-binding protein 2
MENSSRSFSNRTAAPSQPESSPVAATGRPIWRFAMLAVVFALLALLIGVRLVNIQVSRTFEDPVPQVVYKDPAPRGAIVDRNGVPLVVNRYFFQITATPKHLTSAADREEVARQLEETIGLPYENTLSILTNLSEQVYCVLADAVSLDDATKVQDLRAQLQDERGIFPLQSVQVNPQTKRFYPQAELTSHLTGFVQKDFEGVTGLEEYYNQFLVKDGAGLMGLQRVSLDSLPVQVRRFVPSDIGKDLVLTIDRTIQWILRDELVRGLEEFRAQSGTIIVMNPKTGAIMGMVSLPDYDPNHFETTTPHALFSNPALSAQYEPGSVFKIITMAAGLNEQMFEPTTIFTDTGSFTIGGRVIFNSNRVAHGHVSANEALSRSLNVVTAQMAADLGNESFYRYVRLCGFGEATGIDLSGEIAGMIKTPSSRDWSMADLGTNSFGQGLAATPLQMANATAAIASGGKLMRPYIVEARVYNNEVQHTEPAVIRQVLTPEAAAAMNQMMTESISSSNSKAGVAGYLVAGKSGTAQIPTPQGYTEKETIVTFVGFAPSDDPQFTILVKMDRPDPNLNIWAGETAAPVFGRVAKRLLDYLNIPPDEIRLAQSVKVGE